MSSAELRPLYPQYHASNVQSRSFFLCRWSLFLCSFTPIVYLFIIKIGNLGVIFYADCAEKLFDLVDGFAESTKRKAAVWPLQIILLVLCPEIIQDIVKDVVEETKMNKVSKKTI